MQLSSPEQLLFDEMPMTPNRPKARQSPAAMRAWSRRDDELVAVLGEWALALFRIVARTAHAHQRVRRTGRRAPPPASWRAMQQPTSCARLEMPPPRRPRPTVAKHHLLCCSLFFPSPPRNATAPIHSPTAAAPPRTTTTTTRRPPRAMDRFPDGVHVWLRSRERRGHYVRADEDGTGVSLSTDRATLNAAWQAHRIVRGGIAYVLLRCAAYGRYLALSASLARDGHRGRQAVQADFAEPQQLNIRWRAVFEGGGSGDVLLCCNLGGQERYLRANGRYRRWNNGVTVDVYGNGSTMMHWTVVQIPLRPAPPALPIPSRDLGVRTGLLQRRTGPVADRQRTIRYMQANDQGNYSGAETFIFLGRSVFNLTNELATKVGKDMFTITLGVHAGLYGRLTPLVVDLPRSEDPLDIIVLPNNVPAAMGLRHPDVDAPEPVPGI